METGTGRQTPPPLPPMSERGGGGPPKKPSAWWGVLWVSVCVLFLVWVVSMFFLYTKYARSLEESLAAEEWEPVEVSEVGLLDDRATHTVEWVDTSGRPDPFEPYGPADEPPAGVFDLVRYPSPAGELAAYVTPDPGDGERRPAVVWAKGGFGGIGSFLWERTEKASDQSARAFREAGLVLFCPSWRGENDNPGQFELFYGEVDDLLAAVEHVKGLPYVDPDRVYLAGHSTGATLALLAAVAGAEVRAVFAFGGDPALGEDLDHTDPYGNAPYDHRSDRRGNELRSAVRYTPFLRAPVYHFEGGYPAQAVGEMEATAAAHGVVFRAFYVEAADHWDLLAPVTRVVADQIVADTGPVADFSFSEAGLAAAWKRVHDVPVDVLLAGWVRDRIDLEAALEGLGKDDGADDEADVRAMEKALAVLGDADGEKAAEDYARVVALIRPTLDDEALELFDRRLARGVRRWVRAKADGAEALEPREVWAVFDVVRSLIYNYDDEAGALVTELMEAGFGDGEGEWESVMDLLEPEDGMFEHVVKRVRRRLPDGEAGTALMQRMSYLMYDEEWDGPHAWGSRDGLEKLRGLLEAEDGVGAFEAGFALAWVEGAERERLIELGLGHADPFVRMEVAWSDLRTGGERGVAVLVAMSDELAHSQQAVSYLEEFDRGDAVPAAVREPAFVAKAELVEWLMYPDELGEAPETIEVYDQRELHWPPSGETRRMWLLVFTHRRGEAAVAQTSYGIVGGELTWSLFEDYAAEPSPEDLYAHHCALELALAAGQGRNAVDDGQVEAARARLREANPGVFGDAAQ